MKRQIPDWLQVTLLIAAVMVANLLLLRRRPGTGQRGPGRGGIAEGKGQER